MVRLADEASQIEKLIYVLANPVQDHLVERAHHWPGATALGAILKRRSITAVRPRGFFRDEQSGGEMPDVVTINFSQPPALETMPADQFVALVAERIQAREREAAATRTSDGTRIVGRKRLLAQSWDDRPESKEPRRKLSPRVAARDKWRRIEAILRNRVFEMRHRKARAARVCGYNVPFPLGTWAAAILYGALIEPA
jgi:hypothetical protein